MFQELKNSCRAQVFGGRLAAFVLLLLVMGMAGCSDDDDFVNTLQPEGDKLNVQSLIFDTKVTTEVLSSLPTKVSTDSFLVGEYTGDTIGTIHGDLLVQFDAMGSVSLPRDNNGNVQITDTSLVLKIAYSSVKVTDETKDSTLQVKLYKMSTSLNYRGLYSSDINASDYAESGVLLSKDVTLTSSSGVVSIEMPKALVKEFTDAIATTPSKLATTSAFTQFFPGLYIQASSGVNTLLTVYSVSLVYSFNYRNTLGTKITYSATALANDNVRQVNVVKQTPASVAFSHEALILSPSGKTIRVTLPYSQVLKNFDVTANSNGKAYFSSGKKVVVNSSMLYVKAKQLLSTVNVPSYLLFVRKSKYPSYLQQQSTAPDNVNAVLATYSSSDSTYSVSLKYYLQDLLENGVSESGDTTLVAVPVDPTTVGTTVLGVVPTPQLNAVVVDTTTASTRLSVVLSDW